MQNQQDKLEYLEKCLYCGSKDFNNFVSAPDRFSKREEIFTATKCADCGLVFQNPRVKEEFIGEYYGEEDDLGYYRVPEEKAKTFKSRIKQFINKEVLVQHLSYSHIGKKNFLLKILSLPFKRFSKIRSIPKFVNGGKLLEIGCSHGELLKKMKDLGWGVTGIEMSKKMTEYARSIGLDVLAGRIEDQNYETGSFDVIIMNMVLEHLHDPFGNLERITKWLKPGGQLIFSIPYITGTEFKIFKEYSYGLQLPHHMSFPNKKIIIESLKKLGYKNTKFYFHFFDRDIVVPAQWKYATTKKFVYKLLGHNKFVRYGFVKPVIFVLSLFHRTSRVTVYSHKN